MRVKTPTTTLEMMKRSGVPTGTKTEILPGLPIGRTVAEKGPILTMGTMTMSLCPSGLKLTRPSLSNNSSEKRTRGSGLCQSPLPLILLPTQRLTSTTKI